MALFVSQSEAAKNDKSKLKMSWLGCLVCNFYKNDKNIKEIK